MWMGYRAIVLSVMLAALPSVVEAQRNTQTGPGGGGSPHFRSEWTIDSAKIAISYGRPSLRGRPEGQMMPLNAIWRTGADTATRIVTDRPLVFGTVRLAAGTYTINTQPGATSWTLILGRMATPGQPGIPYLTEHEIGRVPLLLGKTAAPVEQLSIHIDDRVTGATLRIEWGTTSVTVPFTVGSESNLREMAASLMLLLNIDTSTVRFARTGDGFPLALLSRGAIVLGATDEGTGRSTTFVAFPSDFRGAVDSLRDRMLITGWRPIESPTPAASGGRGSTPPQGGRGPATLLPTYWCPNGDSLQATWVRSVAATTIARLQHSRSARGFSCSSPTDLTRRYESSGSNESIEIEFLNTVLRDFGFESYRIRLGDGDSTIAWATTATQMTPLGVATFSFGNVTVAHSELSPDQVLQGIAERARSEGFERGAERARVSTEVGFERSGYKAEAYADFCRPPFVVSVSAYPRIPTGSRVAIMHARSEFVPCKSTGASAQQAGGHPATFLKSPNGTQHKLIGRSSSRSNGTVTRFESNASVRSTGSLDSLLQHYSEQLEVQGWTVADSARTQTLVSRHFRLTTVGVLWSAELTLEPQSAPSSLINLRFSARR